MRAAAVLMTLFVTGCVTAPKPREEILLPPSVWPKETTIRWYDIDGDTEAEIRAQLEAKGPEGHTAYTAWQVTWNMPFEKTEEGCTTGPVTTDVRITMRLPRWKGPADQNDPLVQRWKKYLDGLKEHESGHRETGFSAATDIAELLPSLPPKPTCEEARAAADAAASEVLAKYRQRDDEYDAETKHGETQGAVFP